METFRGKVHLPGADREWNIVLEIEWGENEANVRIEEAPGGIADWPGLMVHTFGMQEIVFRTKGIPPLFTHWWHLVRGADDNLSGIVLGLPDVSGTWTTCMLTMEKVT
jgi:hypothetical protein